MSERTVEATTTFVPWYAGKPLVNPYDGRHKSVQRRERAKRLERIRANINASPSLPMFIWEKAA
jgi:hypothetical protein